MGEAYHTDVIRDGEQDRKCDGALCAGKRRDEAFAKVELELFVVLLTAAARIEPVTRANPRKANNIEKQRERNDIADEREVAEGDVVPGVDHGLGQLGSQKHEHEAVQGKGENAPHT